MKYLILIVTIFIITSCSYNLENPKTINIGLKGFESFNFKETYSNSDSRHFVGNNGNNFVKIVLIENTSEEISEKYVNEKMYFINMLYREINSPYPGQISNKIECHDTYKPKENKNSPFNYFFLYANDRFSYGICDENQIIYKSIIFFQFCQDKLYDIELFFDKNEDFDYYENFLKNLKCIN